MESGHCPIGVEPVYLKAPHFYLTSQIKNQPHQIFHGIPDNDDGKQLGNVFHNAHQYRPDRVPDIAEQLISETFCLRKDDEYQRNGDEQLQAHHDVTPYARQKNQQIDLPLCVQQLIPLNGKRLEGSVSQA